MNIRTGEREWKSEVSSIDTALLVQFLMDLREEFPRYSDQMWGVTASDTRSGYKAWGGPPATGTSMAASCRRRRADR